MNKKKKKNICFLLGGFEGNGGIARVTSILLNELEKNDDFNLYTISYCKSNEPILCNLPQNMVQYYLMDEFHDIFAAVLKEKIIYKIHEFLIQNSIDIIIACGALYFPISIMASLRTRTKVYCWEHTSPNINSDYRFQNLCRIIGIVGCDKMITITKETGKYYSDHFKINKNKLVQIYNPLDPDSRKTDVYNVNSKKILTIGRLHYQKNIERLLDIAEIVLNKYCDWTWDIYGDGELKEKLQNIINKKNLSDKIFLKGQTREIYKLYKDYSFYVSTSRYEGFGMTLLEALNNGLPVLSFDIVSGPNEIIKDGINGYLIDSSSNEEMIKKIELLIENTKIRKKISNNAFNLDDKFKLNEIIEKWNKILDI